MEQSQSKPVPPIEKSVYDIKWELKRLTEQFAKFVECYMASQGSKPAQPVAPPQNGYNRNQYNGDYRSNDAPF